MVNRNEALESTEWQELPLEEQMGWKVPIGVMIDIPRLRAHHPVITVAEYLRLQGLSEDLERTKGIWDRDRYHSGNYIFSDIAPPELAGKPSLYVIHNDWYDNDVVRVDSLSPEMKARGDYVLSLTDPSKGQRGQFVNTGSGEVHEKLMAALQGRKVLEWDWTKNVLTGNGFVSSDDDETISRKLEENGWEVLYTYPNQ